MREIELSLNQTQKIRLKRALEKLESFSSKANSNSNASVSISDSIPVNLEDGVLKGHGTLDLNGELVATLCGVVERVNKLVYVRALRARYKPEVGDIVVGRVSEVAQKRWRLDIHYSQDAVLMLSSMNLPDGIQAYQVRESLYPLGCSLVGGGLCRPNHPGRIPTKNSLDYLIHDSGGWGHVSKVYSLGIGPKGLALVRFHVIKSRRRTALDELNMRSIFEENDVICAEVRGIQHDGLHLQARSQKYGKLERGQLLTVPPYLVRRRKQHFHHLEQYGVDLILGCNGFIWVGEHVEAKDDMVEDQVSKPEQQKFNKNSISLEDQEQTYTPIETRQNICRIANAVRVLSILGFNITIEVIMDTMNLSSSLNLDIHEMLGSEFCVLVAEGEAERRSLTKRKG
uniref:Uncharacterized protein n=1 Tax=Quercus lobata TaxID=97700 RepID=A0A7N2KRJ1_QUELO